MGGDLEGTVKRETVFEVLRLHGVTIYNDAFNKCQPAYLLVKGDVILSETLDDTLSREMVHYFQHRFNCPIHYFYNPDMMAPAQEPCGKDE
jgi:hypothetical protein